MRCAKKLDINSVGCFSEEEVELGTVRDDTFLELTIDSGAGENVMFEHMAPRTQVQVSRRQQAGVMCTAANGEIMPNRGVITREGRTKTMNVQVTDVSKALMSVARICHAGHAVVFKPEGGVRGDQVQARKQCLQDDRQALRGGLVLRGRVALGWRTRV